MKPHTQAEAIVREFWRLMETNDFHGVKSVLADDLVVEWPQSKERIRGSENFARMNAEYPAHGQWRFRINELVAGQDQVVTQVSVTDGKQSAEPVPSSPWSPARSRAWWSTGPNRLRRPRTGVTLSSQWRECENAA